MAEPPVPIGVSETIPTTNGGAEAQRVSTTVITEIAARKNVDPVDLPPLYPAVDLDALDSLFHAADDGEASGVARVTFEVFDCEVVVEGPGHVTVQSATTEAEPGLVE